MLASLAIGTTPYKGRFPMNSNLQYLGTRPIRIMTQNSDTIVSFLHFVNNIDATMAT